MKSTQLLVGSETKHVFPVSAKDQTFFIPGFDIFHISKNSSSVPKVDG